MTTIVFAINNGYVKQLSTAIVSMLKNFKKENEIEICILSTDITQENKEKIISLNKFQKNAKFSFIDMKEKLSNFDLEKYMSRRKDYDYISIETYFRFFIPELLPDCKKVIYLDADILVLDDIKKLYDENIDSYYLGVVKDTTMKIYYDDEKTVTKTVPVRIFKDYFKEKLKKDTSDYFNAGVLLMNLDKIRKDNMVEKLWEFAIEESPLEYQDQDILNAVFNDKVKYLDYKWNVLKDSNWYAGFESDKKIRKQILKAYKSPGVFHFVSASKPWLVHKEGYNYANLIKWWDYYKLTPYFKKEELTILQNAKFMRKYEFYKNIFCLQIFKFAFIHIYINRLHFNFKIFDLNISIKMKKNKNFEKLKSI